MTTAKCDESHTKSHKYNRSDSMRMRRVRDWIPLTYEWVNKLLGRGPKLAGLLQPCTLQPKQQWGWACVPGRHTHTGTHLYTPSTNTHHWLPRSTLTDALSTHTNTRTCHLTHLPACTPAFLLQLLLHHGHTGLWALLPLQELLLEPQTHTHAHTSEPHRQGQN